MSQEVSAKIILEVEKFEYEKGYGFARDVQTKELFIFHSADLTPDMDKCAFPGEVVSAGVVAGTRHLINITSSQEEV